MPPTKVLLDICFKVNRKENRQIRRENYIWCVKLPRKGGLSKFRIEKNTKESFDQIWQHKDKISVGKNN